MADSLKVFTNQNNIAVNAASTVPYTFNLVTTSATEQAVVKDLALSVVPAAGSPYKYPLALKLGTSTVASAATGINVEFNGSQIVDVSSSLSVELLAEEEILNYGSMSALIPLNNTMTLMTYDLAQLAGNIEGSGLSIVENSTKTPTGWAGQLSTSGFTIVKDGVTYYCFAGGNAPNYLKIYDADGTLFQNIYLTDSCYWGCEDGGFIYLKPGQAASFLRKIDIATWTVTQFSCGYLGGMTTSNPGFMDSYNGTIYLRTYGNNATINKILLSNGGVTNWSASANGSENIGALITTTTAGDAYIVEYADLYWYARKLSTQVSYQGTQVWPTDPTTTNANTLFNVAPGIVLVSNATYLSSCIIDVNPSTPTIVLSTSLVSTVGNTTKAFASTPFKQSPYVAYPRAATCSVVAAGISVT